MCCLFPFMQFTLNYENCILRMCRCNSSNLVNKATESYNEVLNYVWDNVSITTYHVDSTACCEYWWCVVYRWLDGVVVTTLDLQLSCRWFESRIMTRPRYFWDWWPHFAGKLSWNITTTQVNSALHPSGVAKSSISFCWGKGWKVTAAAWQVTLCDPIWHVISCSGMVILITNCCTLVV